MIFWIICWAGLLVVALVEGAIYIDQRRWFNSFGPHVPGATTYRNREQELLSDRAIIDALVYGKPDAAVDALVDQVAGAQ